MILFSKIMRFCAAQKSMKIFTLRRACAFSFQSFNFVKNFDFISFCAVQKSMKITFEKISAMHVFSLRLCIFIPIFQL